MDGKEMVQTFATILGIAVVYFLLIRPRLARKPSAPYAVPLDTATEVPNDKIIVISDISQTDLQEALADYCSLYNHGETVVYPRLVISNDARLAVVFPFDIGFEPFCNLVNYLVYPPEVTTEPIAIGWGTFSTEEDILPKEIFGKRIMAFVPEEEENHVQLFMVSEENLGIHMQMFDAKSYKVHPEPEERYMGPPFDALRTPDWEREHIDVVVAE